MCMDLIAGANVLGVVVLMCHEFMAFNSLSMIVMVC
jgi:hypothetical protein